jgi:glycosyltransferase involved in cell wall biosynthesis
MKQVWILNHYAFEPDGAGGSRHFSLAEKALAYGWQSTIIGASVEHLTGRQRLGPGETRRKVSHGQVTFLWLRVPEHQGNGFGRIMNMLAYTVRVLLPGYTRDLAKPDVIVGSSVHPLAAWAGAMLARRYQVPFVFEVRDLWPQTLIDFGRLSEQSLVTRVLRRLELWLYRKASRIVVLLPRAGDYIVPLGIPEEKVVWIPNGVDLAAFPPSAAPARGTDQPFTLMYLGSLGQANGMETVLHAMKAVAEQSKPGAIKLRIIGGGPSKPALLELAGRLRLNDVSFEPPVPRSAVPALAATADGFVISVVDRPRLYRYGISMNKLFDYLAGARPIVIASSAVNNPVAEAGAGITVRPNDPQDMAKAIVRLARMPAVERNQMGAAGRHYVEQHHSFERLAGRLASTLDAALAEGDAQRKRVLETG